MIYEKKIGSKEQMTAVCKLLDAVDSITKRPEEIQPVYKVCYIKAQNIENNHLLQWLLGACCQKNNPETVVMRKAAMIKAYKVQSTRSVAKLHALFSINS